MPACLSNVIWRSRIWPWAGMTRHALAVPFFAPWNIHGLASVGQPTARDEGEAPQASSATRSLRPVFPLHRDCFTCSSIRNSQFKITVPLGHRRTTAPVTLRSAPIENGPKFARLPANPALCQLRSTKPPVAFMAARMLPPALATFEPSLSRRPTGRLGRRDRDECVRYRC